MHHCYLAKHNVTERTYKHIILGEIMEESGGPDVAVGEVGKVFIMQDLCLITDRQTGRQGTNPLVFNSSLVSTLFHSRRVNGFERCNRKILPD